MQRDYSIDTGAVALTAATTTYVLGIATGASAPADLVEVCVSVDATATGLLKVELVSWTTDGTGTAYTPKAYNGDAALVAAISSAKTNYTVAPSGTIVVYRTWVFPLPSGPLDLELPLGREFTIPVSKFFGFRMTPTTVSPNGFCTAVIEE